MKTTLIQKFHGILFILVIAMASAFGQAQRPNILLILMDDLGYADVGFMPGAASDIYTPNIDELAHQGTMFTSAYVTHPFCGPSRTSIMSGRMPHVLGAQFNLAAFSGNGIDTSETFISTVLDGVDYYTGLVGKWHLGEEVEYHPNSRGFDYFYGFLGGGHEYFSDTWISHTTYNPSNYSVGNYNGSYNGPMMRDFVYVATGGGLYCTDVLTDAGIEFIENAAFEPDPFFLFMSYNAPHTPVQAKQSDIDSIKSILGSNAAGDGTERLTYTAMMYNADYNIKRLVDELKGTGEYENTLIIFLSDNGGRTDKGALNSPLRGRKGDAYEGGFRVPMFFHWPGGNVPQGYINTDNFSSLDFYPMFAHLAGATIPEEKIYDGMNTWENIINKTNPREDSTIYVMRQHNGQNFTGVVKNNYKLYTPGNGTWYLYDLITDIGETTNISAQHPDIAASMKEAVYRWTWTIKEPEFFDDPKYGFEDSWIETGMPNFAKTFGSLYDSTDYISDNETGLSIHYNSSYIYPNPVHRNVNITFDSQINTAVDAALYDMYGRLVQSELNLIRGSNNSYSLAIDPGIASGNYIIKAKAGTDYFTAQIVISQ